MINEIIIWTNRSAGTQEGREKEDTNLLNCLYLTSLGNTIFQTIDVNSFSWTLKSSITIANVIWSQVDSEDIKKKNQSTTQIKQIYKDVHNDLGFYKKLSHLRKML